MPYDDTLLSISITMELIHYFEFTVNLYVTNSSFPSMNLFSRNSTHESTGLGKKKKMVS